MKLNRKTVFWGIFAALLLASTASSALNLGRVRGAALLGRSLDLSVPVQYGPDEEVTANCFEADASYGDSALERSRISIRTEPTSQPNTLLVHVTSAAAIDEAVVRLTLRATCNSKASRSYTVLADVVSETNGGGAVVGAGRATAVDRSAADTKPVAAAGQTAAGATGAGAASAGKDKLTVDPVRAAERRAARKQAAAAAQADKGAGAVKANSKNQVNAAALEDLQRRVDEIAKWQAANNGDEERQKNEERAKELEASIRGLQAVTAKNQQSIQMVAAAVESSSSQDYGRTLVYGLGAALLVCFAGLLFVASRMRSGAAAPWWSGDASPMAPDTVMPPQAELAAAARAQSIPASLDAGPESVHPSGPATWPAAAAVATGLGELGPSMDFTATTKQAAVAANQPAVKGKLARGDFAASGHGNLKSINTREMLDVRQQAEFFMALGQHDEAVRLLESHINGSADSNPLVLLDLLKILHTLSRRADFERYREEFNAQFTGRIPAYADFLTEGNGLEAYEDICQQIVVLWPTEYTVDFIEQCLVRLPEDDPEQGMDLEAFRDLLLLYGVLKRLDQGYDSNLAPFSTSRGDNLTQTATIGATISAGMDGATVPLPVLATPSTAPLDLDLDLDLSADIDAAAADPSLQSGQPDNLIDFDISGYIDQKKSDPTK